MRHLLGYDNKLFTAFEDQLVHAGHPYEECTDPIEIHNLGRFDTQRET